MVAKRSNRALALLLMVPSAAFALGFGDIRLLSPLNAPLDAQIELVDVTPEELQTLKASIASRELFAQYGLEWPVFLSSVQVKTPRVACGCSAAIAPAAMPRTHAMITVAYRIGRNPFTP